MQLFHWNSCKMLVSCSGFTRRCGLVRPASKSCRFSHHSLRVPEGWHGDFAACGQRSGLLALNLANIFEKLLHQKTCICLRLGNCSQHQRTVYFKNSRSCDSNSARTVPFKQSEIMRIKAVSSDKAADNRTLHPTTNQPKSIWTSGYRTADNRKRHE